MSNQTRYLLFRIYSQSYQIRPHFSMDLHNMYSVMLNTTPGFDSP